MLQDIAFKKKTKRIKKKMFYDLEVLNQKSIDQ